MGQWFPARHVSELLLRREIGFEDFDRFGQGGWGRIGVAAQRKTNPATPDAPIRRKFRRVKCWFEESCFVIFMRKFPAGSFSGSQS